MALDPLSETLSALADPTRRAILQRLAQGEATVNELAEPFAMSLPAVSKHLKVLERARLISRGRHAQWRPCRLEPEALKGVDQWLEDYRRLFEARLDRLEDYLAKLQAEKDMQMHDETPELTLEVISSRVFPVAQDVLFDAFARAEILAEWWGPHGFTNRVTELDLRPGGAFRISMTNSDGQDFHNHSNFEAVERPGLIRFLHHLPMHVFRMEMHFSPTEDGTRLTWRMLFEKNAENIKLKKFIAAANEQNFDRLEAVLSSASQSGRQGE